MNILIAKNYAPCFTICLPCMDVEANIYGCDKMVCCRIKIYAPWCSSVVRAFTHDTMGRQIDPSYGEPIELFHIPASAPRLV